MSAARQPEGPAGPEAPQGSVSRRHPGPGALVPLGLLALLLPVLISLFAFVPAFFVGLVLPFGSSGTGSSSQAWPVVLVLATALIGLGILAALMAFLLRLTRWPRPLGTALLLLAAPLLALVQGPALGLWFNSGPGASEGSRIGPVPLDLFWPGASGPGGYLHLAAVVLPLCAVRLRHRGEARTGLVPASAALALVLPLSTWYTLTDLRTEATEQIRAYADSIEAYPYPVAVLDSPDWRAWHLRFHHEHRHFTVVYTNEDDVRLELTTHPGHDPGPDSGCAADGGPGSPACESFRVQVRGLNDGPSDFTAFEADAVVQGSRTRVDLTDAAAQGYAKTSADEDAPAPAALLEPAGNPRESFLQGETPFRIPPADLREAAEHVRLLNPADTEAVRELASSAYLAT